MVATMLRRELGVERSANLVDAETIDRAWQALAGVPDPEIPIVSIVELGIVRAVRAEAATLVIEVTPTYSGCPATETIVNDIREALAEPATDVGQRRHESTIASGDSVTPDNSLTFVSGARRLTQK